MKITIIANGTVGDMKWFQKRISEADLLICADGGANVCYAADIVPDYVIGDMDSVNGEVLTEWRENKGTKVVLDEDQDKTDMELAIKLANSLDPDEIEVLGAIGDRLDHTLGNIWCLDKVRGGIKARILDENHEIILVKDSLEIQGEVGDIVSVIPMTGVQGLSYEGMKWGVEDHDCEWGWLGVCNRLEKSKAKISVKKGKVLVIKYNI